MTKNKPKKKKTVKKKKITPRKKKFIDFYIETDNATQSYIRAGYSKNGADKSAWNLLRKTEIIEALEKRRLEIAEKADIRAQDVINEIAKIAFANSEDYFDWGTQNIEMGEGVVIEKGVAILKPHDQICRDKKAVIQSIKETREGLEIKLYDKQKALESLKSYFGLNNDAEVTKHKRIKETEQQPAVDPLEGMTEDEIDKRLEELK